MKISAVLLTAAIALTSSIALGAPTHYEFETVTAVHMHRTTPALTGVLRNTTTPITVEFADNTSVSFRYIVNRCVPVFLTMMDKPGKYYLSVVVEPTDTNIGLITCTLRLR
jgi:hypothetical protein